MSLRSRFIRQPLERQVVIVTALAMLPLVALIGWAARRMLVDREAELQNVAASVASTAEATFNQYLRTIDSLGAVLAQHPAVQGLNGDAARPLFRLVLHDQPTLLNVEVVDAGGVVRESGLSTGPEPVAALLPCVRAVLATDHQAVSDLMRDHVTGRPTVVLGYPVRDRGGVVTSVLAISLNLTALGQVFATIPLPPQSVITLTDRTSRVLARTLQPQKYVGTLANSRAADPSLVPATAEGPGVEGIRRIYANAEIARGPWVLSVGIPQREALERTLPLWVRTAGITIGFAAFTFVAVFVMAVGVSRPLGRLTRTAKRIADGDLSPPPATRTYNLELAELNDAFVGMAANLREARDTLDRRLDEERRMRETLQSLQRQVVRQERLAAVGVLVSGVAHELNNPLQAILGTIELLERYPDLSPGALEEIGFIKKQSGRAREIIRNLSRFSSQQSGPPALIDLREVIGEVIQLRRGDLEAGGIVLDVEMASHRTVNANFTEIEQVMLNFLINAQQALVERGRGGRILLRLFDVGRRVRFEVQDDGPGVRPEDEPKLFQPFFTTKPVGKGTGLGLSVSYGIIDSYSGSIGYRANEWGGATFFFELPATDAGGPASKSGDDRSAVLHRSV
ncbi:MAG: sensor histidine kinase [Betaproteobacteria bacterium]